MYKTGFALPAAESSPADEDYRGTLQQVPNTAEREEPSIRAGMRVTGIRLAPTKDNWHALRIASRGAAKYCNLMMRAKYADALKMRAPAGFVKADEKNANMKYVRSTSKDDIGSAVYVACENLVTAAWNRDGKRIMAGAKMPQWNENNALSIHGHSDRDKSGVKIEKDDSGNYVARVQLLKATHELGNWHEIPLHKGKGNSHKSELLEQFFAGATPIKQGRIKIKPVSGKVILELVHPVYREVYPAGYRHAALSNISGSDVERLVLRVRIADSDVGRPDNTHVDFTSRLMQLKKLKAKHDEIKRRLHCQIGRRKGHARAKRKKIAHLSWDNICTTTMHQWSAKMVKWMRTQGVGTFSFLVAGGDWPAYMLKDMLEYKCKDAGITMVEASLDDGAVSKSLKSALKKQQAKAKKAGDAIRTLENYIED